jgi:hypothetical protein
VRLKIGSRQWEQPLTLRPDPRVGIGQPDYVAQLTLAQDLAGALDASTEKLLQLKSLRRQLNALGTAHGEEIAARLAALDKQLQMLLSGAQRGLERVNGDIAGLYEQVLNADAAPTQTQKSAAMVLFKDWQSIAASSDKIWQGLAPLNQSLAQARLPILRSDAQESEEGESTDEE